MTQTDINFTPITGGNYTTPKLSPQCSKLLDAFLSASSRELWNHQMVRDLYILNYTGRISDLRRAGYTIKEIKKEGGSRLYRLEGKR